MKFDFSAFLANDPSTQRAARREESIAKAAALIGDDGTFDFDAYDELDKPTKIGVMNVINDRCTEYKQLKSSNGNVNAAEISDECLRRMIMVTFDVDSFLANVPSTQRAAQYANSNAKAAALIGDDGKFDYDAYDELDKPTKNAVIRVINGRCTEYEQLQSSDDGVSAAKISDECLRRMIAVEFDVSAFQEDMRESQLKRKREDSNRRRLKK